MRKAIFLDRDGTLNKEAGYINSISLFEILPGVFEALKILNKNGWKLIVITNQSGIARGYFDETFLIKLNGHMERLFKDKGIHLDGIYYCPHHPQAGDYPYHKKCNCRKPFTGLIERAAADFNIQLDKSYMVGDRYNDIAAGNKCGLKTVLVKTGYGRGEWDKNHSKWKIQPTFVYENLLEFARDITER